MNRRDFVKLFSSAIAGMSLHVIPDSHFRTWLSHAREKAMPGRIKPRVIIIPPDMEDKARMILDGN
jgi:hypothetical protein